MTSHHTNRDVMMPRVLEILRSGTRFLVTGHERVDGDSTGCEVALHHGLASIGKSVTVVNNEKILSRYDFLDPDGTICKTVDDVSVPSLMNELDAAIVVDNNSWDRLGALRAPFESAACPVLCIDHHVVETPFCDHHLVDTSAAATGELVYDILVELGADIDVRTATALYTSICTDTGWFRFSNTTRRTFEICADLVRRGVQPATVNSGVNYQEELAAKRLLARVLDEFTIECGGRFAWATVTRRLVAQTGASMGDAERTIEHLRSIRGVQFVALLRESSTGGIRISFRSEGDYSAHAVATAMGGGGHRHASGARVDMSMHEALTEVRRLARKQDAELQR